jgi:hypothetical protein
MRLLHKARRMNVVIQHSERSDTARFRRGSDPRCSQQIGGSIRARRIRAPHCAGNDDRFLAADQQVEDEGGFLYCISALDDHGAVEAGREAFLDRSGNFDQVAGG